ncbi:type II toxin-antitoxin system VapC family toxin [Microbacterium sp.]|uniref:type II toxin-antitoxin system VapC family toxin n=1 Tax=Microbacterium sp. TaxID=51671 RepID=UPI0039E3E356
MILDASVVIALRSEHDRHAGRAAALLARADDLIIHPVTLAECLVVPARAGIADEVRDALVDGLGLRLWTPDEDEPVRVATVRAQTRVALPDCYVLVLAEQLGAPLATFDQGLRSAAAARGVEVVG